MLHSALSPRLAATLVLLLAASSSRLTVEARPDGAPACTVNAAHISAGMGGQSQNLHFTIDHPPTYQLGQPVVMVVNGPSSQYKGLLLYAASTSNPSKRVGNFVIPDGFKSNLSNCAADGVQSGPNGVITHANPQPKPVGTRITWNTSAQDLCETLEIHAVVALEKTTWQVVPVTTLKCVGGNSSTGGALAVPPVPCDDNNAGVLDEASTRMPPMQLPSEPCEDNNGPSGSVLGELQSAPSGSLRPLHRDRRGRNRHSQKHTQWKSSQYAGMNAQGQNGFSGPQAGAPDVGLMPMGRPFPSYGSGMPPQGVEPFGANMPPTSYGPDMSPQGVEPFDSSMFPGPPSHGPAMPFQGSSYGPNMSLLLQRQQRHAITSMNARNSYGSGSKRHGRRCRRHRHRRIMTLPPPPMQQPNGVLSQMSVAPQPSNFRGPSNPISPPSPSAVLPDSHSAAPSAYPQSPSPSAVLPDSQSAAPSAYPQSPSSPAGVEAAAATAYPMNPSSPSGVENSDQTTTAQPANSNTSPSSAQAASTTAPLASPSSDSAYFQASDNSY